MQISLNSEEESMSYPPAFPANPPLSPEKEKALKMTGGSGRQCSMLLDQSSPLGAFSKILLVSSHWQNSEEYCYVWNRLDTKFECSAFQLTPLGQSTDGSECSLLGTPDTHQCGPNGGRRNPEGTSLTGRKPDGGKAQIDLRDFAIRMLPTPTARDFKSGSGKTQAERGRTAGPTLAETFQGSLNPRFVEELMGYEIDHTDLKRSETALCPSKRTRSSKRLPKQKKAYDGQGS